MLVFNSELPRCKFFPSSWNNFFYLGNSFLSVTQKLISSCLSHTMNIALVYLEHFLSSPRKFFTSQNLPGAVSSDNAIALPALSNSQRNGPATWATLGTA